MHKINHGNKLNFTFKSEESSAMVYMLAPSCAYCRHGIHVWDTAINLDQFINKALWQTYML